jgi:hypothetical protein
MKEEYNVSFYNEKDEEIGRKTYKGSYGSMITNARKRGEKIKAKYFWHKVYLRKFVLLED